MSDVGGVSGSRRPSFSDEEIQAMRKDESTSAIVNAARRDAGFKEKDVSVRGDDKTLDEVLHHRPSHFAIGETIGAAVLDQEQGRAARRIRRPDQEPRIA
jgi:hypothetical protein